MRRVATGDVRVPEKDAVAKESPRGDVQIAPCVWTESPEHAGLVLQLVEKLERTDHRKGSRSVFAIPPVAVGTDSMRPSHFRSSMLHLSIAETWVEAPPELLCWCGGHDPIDIGCDDLTVLEMTEDIMVWTRCRIFT